MFPSSTDFLSPAQGLVGATYDQSLTPRLQARLWTRRRIGQRRRIAAHARLVMAVAAARRLSEAELRDLLATQPDDAARARLLHELAGAGALGRLDAWAALARLWEAAVPCDHCGEAFVHEDGCPAAEVDGEPVGHGRQLALPLDATDGRDAP